MCCRCARRVGSNSYKVSCSVEPRYINIISLLWTALYQYIKNAADNECKRWLSLVNLGIHVREGINKPNEATYSNVRKCFVANGDLFQPQFHRRTIEELTVSVSSELND